MRRTLLRALAWAAATLVGIAVSWFGVHSVLASNVFADGTQAIPVAAPPSTTTPAPTSAPPSTSASPPHTSTSQPADTTTTTTSAGDVRGYQLTGGRVVLELTETSARLVSAIPEAGWQMQTWQAEGWLRVDFSRDGSTSSCFVTWNGHPPAVQTT